MHNSSGADRVAMVCRYAPWWLSTQEFSGNQVGYLSVSDWEALPERLQPLLRHLVVDPSREPTSQQQPTAAALLLACPPSLWLGVSCAA